MTVYIFGTVYDRMGNRSSKAMFDKSKLLELFQIAIDAKGTDKYDSIIDDIDEIVASMTKDFAIDIAIMAAINGDDLIDSHTIEAMTERFNKIENNERLTIDLEGGTFGFGSTKEDAALAYIENISCEEW